VRLLVTFVTVLISFASAPEMTGFPEESTIWTPIPFALPVLDMTENGGDAVCKPVKSHAILSAMPLGFRAVIGNQKGGCSRCCAYASECCLGQCWQCHCVIAGALQRAGIRLSLNRDRRRSINANRAGGAYIRDQNDHTNQADTLGSKVDARWTRCWSLQFANCSSVLSRTQRASAS